jgi:hypothetical protein
MSRFRSRFDPVVFDAQRLLVLRRISAALLQRNNVIHLVA